MRVKYIASNYYFLWKYIAFSPTTERHSAGSITSVPSETEVNLRHARCRPARCSLDVVHHWRLWTRSAVNDGIDSYRTGIINSTKQTVASSE